MVNKSYPQFTEENQTNYHRINKIWRESETDSSNADDAGSPGTGTQRIKQ